MGGYALKDWWTFFTMEDLITNGILLLIFLAFAAGSMVVAAPNTVVLVLQCFWPTVPATLRGESKRTVSKGKQTSYERDDETGEYGLESRRGTSVSWEPRLHFHYTWQGQEYTKDNRDGWNHRLHYTEKSSRRAIKTFFAQRPYPIKVNPKRPTQIFIGWHQFPSVAVGIATLSSLLFLSVSVSTFFDMLPPNGLSALGNRFYWSAGTALYVTTGIVLVCWFSLPEKDKKAA